MAAREATLRRELRLPTTLIERTTASPSKKPSTNTKKASPRRILSTPPSKKRGSK
jgi:hypothetical protein